jgi:uncharacterized protein (DUF1697 family)
VKYVALLRGINVGGNNRIEMPRLKAAIEELGFEDVRTYINSGNVVFEAGTTPADAVAAQIKDAIAKGWGLSIPVLVRSADQMSQLIAQVPDDWRDDKHHKCDVLFLWDQALKRDLTEELTIKEDIDEVIFTPGEIVWRVARPAATRSGLLRVIGTPLYAQMTVRNINTARKLASLLA